MSGTVTLTVLALVPRWHHSKKATLLAVRAFVDVLTKDPSQEQLLLKPLTFMNLKAALTRTLSNIKVNDLNRTSLCLKSPDPS